MEGKKTNIKAENWGKLEGGRSRIMMKRSVVFLTVVTGASSAGTGRRRGRRSRTSNERGSESEGPDTGVGFARGVQTTGATGKRVLSARDQTCTNKERKSKDNREDIRNA